MTEAGSRGVSGLYDWLLLPSDAFFFFPYH